MGVRVAGLVQLLLVHGLSGVDALFHEGGDAFLEVATAIGQLEVHDGSNSGIQREGPTGGVGMSTETKAERVPVPRDRENDYTRDAAAQRQEFVREQTGVQLEHVSSYSFDPGILTGNVEQFLGVAQVPIGLAGPLLVDGEHAQGEFYVPMATAEGTLVASYNRGMRLLYEAGGVKTTIMADRMQRAPVFIMPSAREARALCSWLDEHFDEIKAAAESTTRSGKLQDIERYTAARHVYTRFNYSTGDAAGQNMTGKATQEACRWIMAHN